MIRKIAIGTAVLVALVASPPTSSTVEASPQIFENLVGKWRGKGLVKASPKGKNESIRCRMTSKPASSGAQLNLSGNCAVSGFVFSLKGYIKQNGGRNSYTASMFRSLANLKQDNFSGKRSGSKINFSFSARDKLSKQNVKATINLNSKSEKAFDVKISRTDPKSGKIFNVGTIKFAKR